MFRTQEFKDIVIDMVEDIIDRRYDIINAEDAAEIAKDVCEDYDYANGGSLDDLRNDLKNLGGMIDTHEESLREQLWQLTNMHEDWIYLHERINDMSRSWYVKLWHYCGNKWSHVSDVFRGVH
jgi:hypothetical protein